MLNFMLLAAIVNWQGVGLLGVGAAVCYFLAKKVPALHNKLEGLKVRCIALSTWCNDNGLPVASRLLSAFVVNDVGGFVTAAEQVLDILLDPVESKVVLDRFLGVQLDKKLATVEGKEELVAAIEKRLNVKINRSALVAESVKLDEKV